MISTGDPVLPGARGHVDVSRFGRATLMKLLRNFDCGYTAEPTLRSIRAASILLKHRTGSRLPSEIGITSLIDAGLLADLARLIGCVGCAPVQSRARA